MERDPQHRLEGGPVVQEAYANLSRVGEMVDTEYRPKKQEILREYELRIRFLSVGCIVSVGCKDIPFRSVKEAMEEVNKYVENPYEEGNRWRGIFDRAE